MASKPNPTNHYACKSKARDGRACRAAATDGGLCFFHANPKKASELGRIGGRKNRHHATSNDLPPLPAIQNVVALRNAVAQLVDAIYSGRLNPKIGVGLAPLLNLQLRAIESSDLEERIAKLEQANVEPDL